MEDLQLKINSLKTGRILDIATGTGDFVQFLLDNAPDIEEIIAIDTSAKAIEIASNYFVGKPVQFKQADLFALNEPEESFDTVTISNSLHHFEDPDACLAKSLRFLKPGGNIIIREMVRNEDQLPAQFSHIIIHHWSASIDRLLGITHNETFTSEEIVSLVDQLHLSNIDMYSIDFPVNPSLSEEAAAQYKQMIEMHTKRIENNDEYNVIKEQGEHVWEHIQQHGMAPARTVFLFATKA